MKNVVLIGMPGCGKSTVARALSGELKMPVYDIDALVEARENKSIPEIFRDEGEVAFRDKESRMIEEVAKKTGVIVSCGGGAVLWESNMRALKANGFVVYIKRDVSALSTRGRPLSKDAETLKIMERERTPLYEKYADYTVNNDTTPEDTAKTIARGYYENTRS